MTEISQPEYGIVVAKDLMVPMRDGVRLATDVYRPAIGGEPLPGPLPAILGRTSYDKSNDWLWVKPVCEYFCVRGYAVVCQDLRGRYRSEGFGQYFHTANPLEGPDGYDTIEWIASQPWSNGRVGMTGSSHGAIVQQVAALHSPPHLEAIWPDVGPTNIYAHEAREGGAMSLQMFGALFLHAFDSQEVHAQPGAQVAIVDAMEHMRDWAWRTPFKPGQTPLALVPALEKTLFDYYWRGRYDVFWGQEACDQEPYWRDRHPDIPGVYSGGWWDPFAAATTKYFHVMSEQNRTPQRLVMGAWTHDGMRAGFTYQGDVDFGPDSVWGYDRYNRERLRWFDRWLKGVETGVGDDPPVQIFVMGGGDGHRTPEGHLFHGGRWRNEQEWPLARTRPVDYFLGLDGGLSPSLPAERGGVGFAADPAHPVPTIGGSIVGFYEMVPVLDGIEPWFADYIPWRVRMRNIIPAGAFDQREQEGFVGALPPYPSLASRPDVLVFQTPVLEEAVEVTGEVVVRLWVSSNAPDTDFTAKLVDVHPPNPDYPDGYHLGLVDSVIRTRYREGWDREVLMEPGTVYPVEIRLAPTSNLFAVGHRIRLDIAGSNFPRFDINPNTGEAIGKHTHTRVANNSVHISPEHPSRVTLPLIP